ncbi:arginine/serine-rich protein PNISR [Zeugodacus cucurbitae]|uniref:arginine/serine-rich protein PNISR n=1 Tax=Zeugodacus cucurbitae TaxID=28588 RepID=UPI0023D8F7EB|nr:arginine/serine-rich protein PNISR [Zeugodacus cucurbitae]
MYSAGDSSGDGLSGLNQFAGMSGSIDWAAMAQQWIQMHDTSNFMSMPDAPPPPNISNTFNEINMVNSNLTATSSGTTIKKSFDEKGEADMDMDEDEESARCGITPPPPAPPAQQGKNRELVMQPQTPWYMQQQNLVVGPPVAENITDIGSTSGPIIPSAPQWNATVWPPRINLPPPVPPTMLNVPLNSSLPNPTAHIPSLLKMNVPNPNTVRMISANTGEQNPTQSVVDAKKRKMLPAWIREGLEKMEREKQKQLEREQSKKDEDPEDIDGKKYTEFVGTTDDATHTVNMKYKPSAERENERSGFEDEGEIEDLDGVAINEDTLVLPQNATTNDDNGSGISGAEYETDNENTTDQENYKGKRSYEDRLADLMIVVRTTLTELLLEVTNQEITNLAQEAVNAHKAKASSAQVIRKSALSSITGKLGLAAYDDSTGDESSDSEDGASADNDPNNDSEEEIKASIRAKRRAFAKITDDIEESIVANAAREEQKLKYYSSLEKRKEENKMYKKEIAVGEIERSDENSSGVRPSTSSSTTSTVSKSYDRDFGETTETKLQNSNGKRQKERNSRKERTTRFSDNKDSKSAAAVAATYMSKIHSTNANLSGNANGSTIFPISSTTIASSVGLTSGSSSTPSAAMSTESSHIAYNVASTKLVDDNSSGGVTALNKNLLNAAEAAYEKVTKSHRASSSRSSTSRSERERSHRSRHYDHRDRENDRYRERDSERERKRNRERENARDNDRGKEHRYHQKSRDEHSSDEDDNKHESQTSSSDTDTSSTSSTSSSSSSQQSSHYSRTSTSSKKRREHEYDRRKRRDERSHRSARSGRSRSHSRQRSHHHSQRGSSYRHSSAEDDNDSRTRYSSSRHGSSRKRSRSRSRSTYSSSSHWRRH